MPAKVGRLAVSFYRAGVRLSLPPANLDARTGHAWTILDRDQVVELEGRLLDWLLTPYADADSRANASVRP